MRVCVVGAGLAGSLLAWRLAATMPANAVELITGTHGAVDATAASGGAVRVYETHPVQRQLALASLRELTDSPVLRRWSGFRPAEFIYLQAGGAEVASAVAEVEEAWPGAVEPLSRDQLHPLGFAELPAEAVAVRERRSGYLSPTRWREALLADAVACGARVVAGRLTGVRCPENGPVVCQINGQPREYDQVVLATGGWTGALLAACGLPASGYRTKSIQYTVYRTGSWRPEAFADEFTGLYGRPDPDGLLLGLATDQWDVPPERPPVTPSLHQRARHLAQQRFPRLWIGAPVRTVGAVDCYCADPVLSLRPVPDTGQRLFTFTGGAGGAVKTALAASQLAAHHLSRSGSTPGQVAEALGDRANPLPVGPQRGLS